MAEASAAPAPPPDAAANAAPPAAAPAAPPQPEPGTTIGGQAQNGKASSTDYRLTGQVTAMRRSQIAFRITGVIKDILVKPGLRAKAGQPLATLDDRDFVLRYDLAKARLDQAKVQLEEADKELKREQEFKARERLDRFPLFDKIKSGADQTRLGVRLAELDLQNAQFALRDYETRSPPTTASLQNSLSTTAKPCSRYHPAPVFEIYDTAEPEVTLSVPERLMGQVKIGSKLKIIVSSRRLFWQRRDRAPSPDHQREVANLPSHRPF